MKNEKPLSFYRIVRTKTLRSYKEAVVLPNYLSKHPSMVIRYALFSLFLLMGSRISAQIPQEQQLVHQIDSLFGCKDFFTARDVLQQNKDQLSELHTLRFGAKLDNAFNLLASSNEKIDLLFRDYADQLSPGQQFLLLEIQQANHAKLYEYAAAEKTIDRILKEHRKGLDRERVNDFKNTNIIWKALAGQPKQSILIEGDTYLQMNRDKARLLNLTVSNGTDSLGFIFDTGANLSTVTESTAKWLNITILAKKIEVMSITGESIYAKIGICPSFTLGNIEVRNSVFIVFPDKQLAFPQIDYQINGIIGFPVLEALKEIQITQKDEFIVPLQQTQNHVQNMAIDFLTPIIRINGDSYTFDTGADKTMLYPTYFRKHQSEIEGNFDLKDISFGGAGGTTQEKGYAIPFEHDLFGTPMTLPNVPVLIDHSGPEKRNLFYGNIGQDLIRQFDKMILNFDTMFIGFEGISGN